MSNKRPFAVGDFLIIETPSMIIDNPPPTKKYTAECSKVFSDGFIAVRYESCINRQDMTAIFDSNGYSIDGHDAVKTIRCAIKGSAEARDIVAMLAQLHHKGLSKILSYWLYLVDESKCDEALKAYWDARKRGGFNEQNANYICYQKAKSMLK